MADSNVVRRVVGGIMMNDSSAQDLLVLFAYEGFNPEMVIAHFAKVMGEKGVDEKAFSSDIKKILILGAMKGNYNGHNKMKISEEGRKVADELFKKYDLSEGGASHNRKAVNLPRIMATFPIVATQAIMIAPDKAYSNAFSCSSLSRTWRNPLLPALIPHTMHSGVRDFLLLVATCFTAEQTMTLRQMTDPSSAYEQQVRYATISHASSEPSEDDRLKYMSSVTLKISELKAVVEKFNVVLKKSAPIPSNEDFQKAGFKQVA